MKKVLCFLFVIFISALSAYAKDIDKHSIRYNGEKYYLMYSTENKESGGYLNEYYKLGENYYNWSEMVAVHSFPSMHSPFDQIRLFKKYLATKNCKGTVTFDDKSSAAMIDFVMVNDKNIPNILEFNIFKYQQTQKGGSAAFQYVKRYTATTTLQAQEAKKEFAKGRKDAIKEVRAYKIPPIIKQEYDKYKVTDSNTKDLINLKKEEMAEAPVPAPIKSEVEAPAQIQTETQVQPPLPSQTQAPTEEPQKVVSEITVEEISQDFQSNNSEKEAAAEPVLTKKEVKEEISLDNAPSEIELIQKQPGYDKDIYPVKSKKKSKKEKVNQEKAIYAPHPEVYPINSEEKKVKKAKKEKKVKSKNKENSYQVINSKEDFYAKPVKRKNISPKKAAKLKAKENEKKLKENL